MQRPEAPLAPFEQPVNLHVFELLDRCGCDSVIPEVQVTELFCAVTILAEKSESILLGIGLNKKSGSFISGA